MGTLRSYLNRNSKSKNLMNASTSPFKKNSQSSPKNDFNDSGFEYILRDNN